MDGDATVETSHPWAEAAIAYEAKDVLAYWFDRPGDVMAHVGFWFRGGPDVDQEVTTRFGRLVESAVAGALDDWAETPWGALALILLLDQFTRNVYRNDPQAFAGDGRAQAIAKRFAEAGLDGSLEPDFDFLHYMFLSLPLGHAEDVGLQALNLRLLERLEPLAEGELRLPWAISTESATDHHDIVARFGRFPDRNKVLGREPTFDETIFMVVAQRGWFEPQD